MMIDVFDEREIKKKNPIKMKKLKTTPWWHHLLHRSNQPFQHPDTHTQPTTAPTPTNPTSPKVGDFINHFGLTFYWSSLHRSCQDLQPLRKEGDHLSDQALLSMRLGPSGDPIEQLLTSSDPSIVALYQQLTTVPSWVDWKRVKREIEDMGALKFTWTHLKNSMYSDQLSCK